MSILVIGAGGYLGSTIERIALENGLQVAGWRSSREDASSWLTRVAAGEFSAVINTAAAKFRTPEPRELPRYWAANVELPYRLGEATRAGGAALIHIGTRWSLGEAGEGPNSLYAATKGFGDELLTSTWGRIRSEVVIVRVRDLIGPRDPRSSLPQLLAAASREGRELPMTSGDQLMDPIDVRDVATSLLRTVDDVKAESGPPAFSEIALKPLTVREFVADWQEATGRGVEVAWGALPYRGVELFTMEQVHPSLPRFLARARPETYRDTLEV